ncbi:preprotein translocase subunit SecE [bacterium]|nr:preprotein translocase subunit SecE [bacterium]
MRKFLEEVLDQLKQVTWPDKNTLFRLTMVVILVSLTVGVILGGFDFLLTQGIKVLVRH